MIITETAYMENFKIPGSAEVTINPMGGHHDFDAVLVQYNNALELKRISFKTDGGFDLIDLRGIAASVPKDDLDNGLFRVIGKVLLAILHHQS